MFSGLCALALAVSMDDIMDVHPDGTPEHARELKEFLMSWDGDLVTAYGEKIRNAVMGNDLDRFTETFQEHNQRFIFEEDGSARDIARWRDNVREDQYYSTLLMESAPDMYRMIADPMVPDEDVQEMLRQHQLAAQVQARHEAELQQERQPESTAQKRFAFKPPKAEL